MSRPGKGQLVNRTVLSETFGVGLNTVDGWVRAGCPAVQRGSRGVVWIFNTADVAKWLRDQARLEGAGTAGSDEGELKRRKLAAETERAELELVEARKLVAPIEQQERAWSLAFAELRANVLNVPGRVVTQLIGETDEQRFKDVLRAELVQALELAAEADIELDDDFDGEEVDE